MEGLKQYIDILHHEEEDAFLTGDQERMRQAGEQLDILVTDEVVQEMEGEE